MMSKIVSLISGIIFGVGLSVSNMINPEKVLGFLDLFDQWDPSLIFVMMGAIIISAPIFFLFRNKNKPTDVLSFPSDNKMKYKKNLYLGDIAISYEIVNKRSKNSNFSLEFDKMWIHGYLHLLGHDHIKNKDFMKMKKLEDLILNKFYKKN